MTQTHNLRKHIELPIGEHGIPQLIGRSWDINKPAGIILVIHGLGEHMGRYDSFATFFNQRNISVIGFDLPGFGQSPGKRGHGISIELMLSCLKAMVDYVASNYPTAPLHVFGQSMGGNIALNYQIQTADDRIQSYIIGSPWIKTAFEVSPLLIKVASVASKILPQITKSNDLIVEEISDLSSIVEAYKSDPLVNGRISLGFGYSMYLAANQLDAYTGPFNKPTYIAHAKNDKLTSFEATANFVKRNPAAITFKSYPDLKHELHNSSRSTDVLEAYYTWMNSI